MRIVKAYFLTIFLFMNGSPIEEPKAQKTVQDLLDGALQRIMDRIVGDHGSPDDEAQHMGLQSGIQILSYVLNEGALSLPLSHAQQVLVERLLDEGLKRNEDPPRRTTYRMPAEVIAAAAAFINSIRVPASARPGTSVDEVRKETRGKYEDSPPAGAV